MINKIGSICKLASVTTDLPTNIKIDKIIEPKKSNMIYFRARAISALEQGPKGVKWNFNGNFDGFPKAELLKAYKTFCGRSLHLNHDTSSPLKAVGKVLDSFPAEDPDTGEFYIETLSRVDSDLHPELAKMIVNGDLNSVSMGASCGTSMCSVCGLKIHSDQDQKCHHMARLGQEFEAEVDMPEYGIKRGEKVPSFCINSDLTFSELSVVSVPADNAALIKSVISSFSNRLQKIASKESNEGRLIFAELDTMLSLLHPIEREAIKNQICGLPCACEKKEAAGYTTSPETWHKTQHLATNQKDEKCFYCVHPEEYEKMYPKVVESATPQIPDQATMIKEDGSKENMSTQPNMPAGMQPMSEKQTEVKKLSEVEQILSKLSGLEYDRLQEHVASKVKARDNFMDNLKTVVKADQPVEVAALPVENPMDKLPELNAPELNSPDNKVPESKEVKEEKSDVKKLEEAEKLIKEVKEHEKAELKEESKEDKGPEAKSEEKDQEPLLVHLSVKKPVLTAKFTKKPFLSQSFWTVSYGDKSVLTASLRDICGEHLAAMRNLVVSENYGKRLIARIQSDGLERVAGLLNTKASGEAMEHLRGKEWNQAAHEKGFNEVKKMQEGEESAADKSKKAVDRPYGEPGDHLKSQASVDKKAAEEGGFSPKAKDNSNAYEKGGAEVVKAHEANEREAGPSRKAIDRPYGEPGDHIKAQAKKKAAQEEGLSPALKDHQKDYEKGGADVKNAQEALQKEVNKDVPEHMRVKTSYEGGEHLVAKPAAIPTVDKKADHACDEACKCPCLSGGKCSCKVGMYKGAGKVEPLSSPSPDTLSKAEKLAGEVEPPGPSASGSQNWDKGKDLFKSDKVPSNEAKIEESCGKEAKLEKDEKTMSEAWPEGANPAGGAREDLMKPLSDKEKEEAVGHREKAADISKGAKLEPGEQKLSDAEKESTGSDDLKVKKGPEAPSDEAKAKEIGREAVLDKELVEARQRIKQLEVDLTKRATELGQEKLERSMEAKMQKCRKLVEEMIKRDLLAENNDIVEKYVKDGQNLLDARKSALKETIDLQLASFLQMPDNLLRVQAETFSRMRKVASPSDKLRIAPHVDFHPNEDELSWMSNLPWK